MLVLVFDHCFLGGLTLEAQLRDTPLKPIAGSPGRIVFRASLQVDVSVCDCVRHFGSEIRISGLEFDLDRVGYAKSFYSQALIK